MSVGGVVYVVDVDKFLSEFGWCEFSYMLLYYFLMFVIDNFCV